jgi:hypothetical protein
MPFGTPARAKRLRNFIGPGVAIVVALAIILGGAKVLPLLGFDPNSVAAVASAVAGVAAFLAARRSSRSAQDAVLALSLTSKPHPRFDILPADEDQQRRVEVGMEHPLAPIEDGWLSWKLHDGAHGVARLRDVPAPYGHPRLNIGDPAPHGTDTFTLEYRGVNGPVWWRMSCVVEYGDLSDPERPILRRQDSEETILRGV